MRNKENMDGKAHNRHCFYAFKDKKIPDILWCVPISSQIKKYQAIYDRKISNQIAKGIINPKCDTIRFGKVMGAKKAFLIQNMFPITENYLGELYINRLTCEAVRIPKNIERDIIKHANLVLRLVRSGNKNLVFSDILATYGNLAKEIGADS